MSYTTGVYAAAVFDASLSFLINQIITHSVSILLPAGRVAEIHVNRIDNIFITKKANNDDEDVTKGCHIYARTSFRKEDLMDDLSSVHHQPHVFSYESSYLYLYAAKGVGVITKKGLKVPPGYPAINPVPQSLIFEKWKHQISNQGPSKFYSCIGVKEGEEIAPHTANPKLGIMGGISILGTGGIVKPLSSAAYIESIEAELSVAYYENISNIVLVLGNQSRELALRLQYSENQIIECGNFLYETIQKVSQHHFHSLTMILGTGKACKLAQGFKNTHRKEGEADLPLLKKWIIERRPQIVSILPSSDFNTTLDAEEKLIEKGYPDELTSLLAEKASLVVHSWIPKISNLKNICIIVKGKESYTIKETVC